jgi:hypothetical protein
MLNPIDWKSWGREIMRPLVSINAVMGGCGDTSFERAWALNLKSG